MNTSDACDGALPATTAFQLVYSPIHRGCSFAFPCDEAGLVELNTLSQRARDNYLLARALVGRDYYTPVVIRTLPDAEAVTGVP